MLSLVDISLGINCLNCFLLAPYLFNMRVVYGIQLTYYNVFAIMLNNIVWYIGKITMLNSPQSRITHFYNDHAHGRCVGECPFGQEEEWIAKNPHIEYTRHTGPVPVLAEEDIATEAELENFFRSTLKDLGR